jgi:O-antigen ligase
MPKKIFQAIFLTLLGLRPFLSARVHPIPDIIFCAGLIASGAVIIAWDIKVLRRHPLASLLALFLATLMISIAFSQDKPYSFTQFYKYAAPLVVFFAVASLSRLRPGAVPRALLISASLVALYALRWVIHGLPYALEYLNGQPAIDEFAVGYLSRGRAFMPFVFPSALAGFLILLLPLAVATLIVRERAKKNAPPTALDPGRIVLASGVSLMTLSLLASQSVGAILSLGAAAAVVALKTRRIRLKRTFVLIALAVGAALLFIVGIRQGNPDALNRPLQSLQDRLSYWQMALCFIRQHPWTGYGLGIYPFFKSISPHNSLLQLWAETGLLGLVSFLLFLGATFKTTWEKLSRDERLVGAGLLTGHLAFLLHNIVDFTFFQPEVSLSWWAVAALLTTLPEPDVAENRS